MLKEIIYKRLPKKNDITNVYAVIVFMVYAWAIVLIFNKLPGYIKFMTLGEVMAVFCYIFFISMVESSIIMGILLLICVILPPQWLKKEFSVRGTTAAFVFLISLMIYWLVLSPEYLIFSTLLAIMSAVIAPIMVSRLTLLRTIVFWISSRLTIFLFIYIPLSVLSLLVIILRNIITNL